MTEQPEKVSAVEVAGKALDRMKRASERGTGCHLTSEMVWGLSCTLVGSLWDDIPGADGEAGGDK